MREFMFLESAEIDYPQKFLRDASMNFYDIDSATMNLRIKGY